MDKNNFILCFFINLIVRLHGKNDKKGSNNNSLMVLLSKIFSFRAAKINIGLLINYLYSVCYVSEISTYIITLTTFINVLLFL